MQLKKTLLAIGIVVTTMLVPSLVYGQAYGKVNVETLNMRQEPNTKATNVGQLNQKDEVQIIGRANEEWLQVKGKDGKSAYVFSEYISVEEAEGAITGSNVFDTLSKGDKVVIQYTVDGWCKVIHDGREGFVSAEYVDSKFMDEIKSKSISEVKRIVPTKVEAPAQTESTASKNNASGSSSSNSNTKPVASSGSLADTIIQDAKQFLGNPYVYGGNSLTNGVDCSGFTQQMMKRHGISISRTSSSQYANDGYKVSRDELRKGDLVFFGYNGSISHVGIYIGNGQMIHSGTSSTGITISSLEGAGKPYIGAKRVL